MRCALLIVFVFLWFTPANAQTADSKLRSELEALHARWFKAFDTADGTTMDQIEVGNLYLVMPNGFVFTKKKSRSSPGSLQKQDPLPQRTLKDVSLRGFGDTAILTGVLNTKTASESLAVRL